MNKLLLVAFAVLTPAASHAQVYWLRSSVTDNGGISDEYLDLAGTVTNDLVIYFDGQLGAQQMLIELSQGSVINHPFGSDVPPLDPLVDLVPTLAFDSFVAVGGFTSETSLGTGTWGGAVNIPDGAPRFDIPQAGVFQDFNGDGGVDAYDANIMNTYWGGPLPEEFFNDTGNNVDNEDLVFRNWGTGVLGGSSRVVEFGPERLNVAWSQNVGIPGPEDQQNYPIARVTLTDDARGTLRYFGTTQDDFGVGYGGGQPYQTTLPIFGGAIGIPSGDFTGDGRTDNDDLGFLLGNWGADHVPPAWIYGFTAPVDNGELNALLDGWGQGVSIAVPEPSSALLVGALAMGALVGRPVTRPKTF